MGRNSIGKVAKIIAVVLFVLLCSLIGYFTLFRELDAAICIPRVSRKLEINPDQNHVYQYVKKQITPGLSKAEVMDRLSKIGITSIKGTTVLSNGTIREGIEIKICLHPLNNILVLNSYSKDWILLGSFIEEDSP